MVCRAGAVDGVALSGVEMLALDDVGRASPGHLVIVLHGAEQPRAYQLDIVIRRAIAAEVAALLFVGEITLAATSRSLADRGALPVLTANAAPSELAVSIDRLLRGGAAEALGRAEHAIAVAAAACGPGSGEGEPLDARSAVLDAASAALGVTLRMIEDPAVTWTDSDAVCIGEVAVGRLVADQAETAVAIALPVVAALLSRALQRESQLRFGPARSRADLVVELLLAESSRIDALAVDAARAGLPVAFAHAAAWITPRHRDDPERRLPAAPIAALELNAFQLTDGRDETWHLAVFHDDLVVVASEESGAPDHQRRVRDVVERLVAHGTALAGEGWTFTVGLGTPQSGASGLRQSATEARITAGSAVAAGRLGAIEVTDVTGLRRVLLDFYASPLSRALLDDVLAPLDALGAERSAISVRTLLAYLSNRNSLARAGEVLLLHPNAVNYRIRRIEQSLALDLDDPDTRFALELACRLRLMATTP
ncbi:PucR family transcriptional regulator [Rathayibacter sp. VKM Ac-2803]|nr:PucR family transcriptional regulator [Rathayibacter sp. VKM Ac-2803]MWV58551.1 PucR family transcriptional regulator [Rathayibacter sp. VKM Ac-2754]